jgi:hypothetical protein
MRTGRGHYRKSYIVPHGRGYKYVRAVPEDLRYIENKSAWVKCLGNVSRAEPETLAHGLAYEHGRRILALRALNPGRSPPPRSVLIGSRDSLGLASAPIVRCTRPGLPAPSLEDLIRLWERVRTPRSAISKAGGRFDLARSFSERAGTQSWWLPHPSQTGIYPRSGQGDLCRP